MAEAELRKSSSLSTSSLSSSSSSVLFQIWRGQTTATTLVLQSRDIMQRHEQTHLHTASKTSGVMSSHTYSRAQTRTSAHFAPYRLTFLSYSGIFISLHTSTPHCQPAAVSFHQHVGRSRAHTRESFARFRNFNPFGREGLLTKPRSDPPGQLCLNVSLRCC